MQEALYQAAQTTLEAALLDELSPEAPWALIERFTTLVRESGSEDEREAARYIAARLKEFGVPHQVYEPDLFLSVPVKSSLVVNGKTIRAKSPAFSASTGPGGVTGTLVSIPSLYSPRSVDLFDVTPATNADVKGKIVIIDGYGGPPPIRLFEQMGAIAQIYVNPGVDIHWGICTTIWGVPDLDNFSRQPARHDAPHPRRGRARGGGCSGRVASAGPCQWLAPRTHHSGHSFAEYQRLGTAGRTQIRPRNVCYPGDCVHRE
jgi:hypothetical protein